MKEVVFVLDRSGSMWSTRDDAIGGFNEFLKQKSTEDIRLTLVQFDHQYEVHQEGRPIAEVPPLTAETYQPRGQTALLDAIGRTIDDTGARLASLPADKRPEKVILGILTDGMENASYKFTKQQIKEKIEHQQNKYQWEFVFMAQNYEQFADAHAGGAQNFSANLGMNTLNSSNVANMRIATSVHFSARV